MVEISPNMTINDVIKLKPETMKVFSKYQLDTCCGGHQEIDAAALLYGADLEKLMEELRAAFREKN